MNENNTIQDNQETKSYYVKMAKDHWESNLPVYYNHLMQEGILDSELERAGQTAEAAVQSGVEKLMAEIRQTDGNPEEFLETARRMAEEAVLPAYILLEPEEANQLQRMM